MVLSRRGSVLWLVEKRPENKFQSARDLSFALGAMSQTGTSPTFQVS
jgi:hypothetical protein